MQKLPHGLADPLHLQEPVLLKALVASALVLIFLVLLWRWLQKRRRRRSQAPPPQPVPAPLPSSGLQAALEAIWRIYREKPDYRGGCHELSRVLRAHFESRIGRPLSRLTAREIGRQVGDTALTRLLDKLAEFQFGRRAPQRAQFESVYRLASRVAASSSEETA